jgi:four helix bundle protein
VPKIFKNAASETLYWLEIIKEMNLTESIKINETITEAKEILAIFTSVGKN